MPRSGGCLWLSANGHLQRLPSALANPPEPVSSGQSSGDSEHREHLNTLQRQSSSQCLSWSHAESSERDQDRSLDYPDVTRGQPKDARKVGRKESGQGCRRGNAHMGRPNAPVIREPLSHPAQHREAQCRDETGSAMRRKTRNLSPPSRLKSSI